MDVESSTSRPTSGQGSRFFSTAVEHPRLAKTDAASVRLFLRRPNDQYVCIGKERARQIVGQEAISSEAATPLQMKFCVDAEWLGSLIELHFLPEVPSYDEVNDEQLRDYLSKKAEESKNVETIETLDLIVENELHTDMEDKDARSRIQTLFVSFKSLLRRNRLSWIIKDNGRKAVYHVLSAICPEPLCARFESDIELCHCHLRKDFKGFMMLSIKLSKAFQLVDNGPPSREKKKKNRYAGKKGRRDQADDVKHGNTHKENRKPGTKQFPIFLYRAHKAKGYRHFLKKLHGLL